MIVWINEHIYLNIFFNSTTTFIQSDEQFMFTD